MCAGGDSNSHSRNKSFSFNRSKVIEIYPYISVFSKGVSSLLILKES